MALASGTRLGPYEILSPLGVGGMGEVYRARDAKLNRDVAIKVLPDLFAGDPDRLARFEREAQVLAALNHPNIAQIYGMETIEAAVGGRPAGHALVMEFVPGQTLADMIIGRALPLPDALAIARQIADALEAAHEQGIIHRDLKPANIKVRDDGTVKLLDFGLAKAMSADGSGSGADAMNSPTLTARATQIGTIIGTAAYMAPEQARGRAVDRRADIWAFGVVLFEMLTGRRAFEGEDISITLAAVLKEDVSWNALPADLPAPVRRLLRRCLEKDPRRRLSAIGDARLELNETSEAAPDAAAVTPVAPTARRSWPMIVASTAAGIAITALAMFQVFRPTVPTEPRRLTIVAPENTSLFPDSRESALSPDGRMVAFVTGGITGIASTQLWVRPLSEPKARVIQGVAGAHLPFWSPDSKRIGFFANGKLNTIAAEGGRIDVVCDAPDGRGATWNSTDEIVFAPASAGPLMRVSARGGEPAPATSLDAGQKETGHRFPFFLPDGRHFLFAALPGANAQFDIVVGSLDNSDRTKILSAGSAAVYAEPGYLLFARKGVVAAQPFDAKTLRLSGDPVTLDDAPGDIGNQYSSGPAVSEAAGTLVYLNDPFADTRLAWVSPDGRELGVIEAAPARYTEVHLSPDNQRAAVVRAASAMKSAIWVVDLARHGSSKIADSPGLNYMVAWSPDGSRLAYTNDRTGTEQIVVRDAAGATPEAQLYESPDLFKKPSAWSPDGSVLFTRRSPETGNDLMTVKTSGDAKAALYLNETSDEDLGRFSPDGRWVAYVSNEAGPGDVYVRSFPTPNRKYRVTTDGGTWVTWNASGTQLMIVGADGRQLKIADVRPGTELSIGVPKVVGALPAEAIAWDASRDLQRLFVSVPASGSAGLSFTVVIDWIAALAGR